METVLLLHCSDIHLSASEKEYSLNVLKEIIKAAADNNVDFLLFSGDTFDTFTDAEELRSEFRKEISELKCISILLPGNHENLKANNRQLSSLDFGDIIIAEEKPFGLHTYDFLEILTIPHNTDYRNYLEWKVPEKNRNFRICMAHGIVSGITYTGPDEDGGTVLDSDLFRRFNIDYAAMGHIHTTITNNTDKVYYPGSARIWRKGEAGPRFFNLIELNRDIKDDIKKDIKIKQIPIINAGQYREYKLLLSLEGKPPQISKINIDWSKNDWIDINLSGIVEDEKIVSELDKTLKEKYLKTVRRLDINRENISVLEGISTQVIAKRFLEAWKDHEPDNPAARNIWLKSREISLNKIKTLLLAKK